jgi:hypothetical protein
MNFFEMFKMKVDKMEKKFVEEELTLLMEVTLRLEDELNSMIDEE